MPESTSSLTSSSLTHIVLFSLNMTDKPLLLGAILESENAMAIMTLFSTDRYLDIEVEGDVENGKRRARSQYSVRVYVADKEVAKSTKSKPRSSVLKWEWNTDNQMWVSVMQTTSRLIFTSGISWFEPSSMMKIVLNRGFGTNINLFYDLVGQHEGKVVDLLKNGKRDVRYVHVFLLNTYSIDASFDLRIRRASRSCKNEDSPVSHFRI